MGKYKREDFASSKLTKWFFGVLIAAGIAFIGVLGTYWYFVDGEISNESSVWGTYGSYVGGVLGPILSFLALLALLRTIDLQNQQLEKSKTEAIKQADHLEREFKRTDYHRLIEKLAERINQNYKENCISLTNDAIKYQTSIFHAIQKDTPPKRNLDIARMQIGYENHQSSTFNTIWTIEDDLKNLCIYIKRYEVCSQYSDSPVKNFYKREFADLIIALIEYDFISDNENIELFSNFIYTD